MNHLILRLIFFALHHFKELFFQRIWKIARPWSQMRAQRSDLVSSLQNPVLKKIEKSRNQHSKFPDSQDIFLNGSANIAHPNRLRKNFSNKNRNLYLGQNLTTKNQDFPFLYKGTVLQGSPNIRLFASRWIKDTKRP